MKTGFSLCGNTTHGKPCTGPVRCSKSSKFKGETQQYVEKLSKSAGARHYCPKIPRVPGTLAPLAPVLTQALKWYMKKSNLYLVNGVLYNLNLALVRSKNP